MAQARQTDETALQRTPLHALHERLGARMVPFAGYEMPVQYPAGIMAEHKHTRAKAGLFDVSHMGQAWLFAPDGLAELFERLVPGDIAGLGEGRMRYTQLTTADGGIIDDLMVTRMPNAGGRERLFVVVNASRKAVDLPHIASAIEGKAEISPWENRALIALQGPAAAEILAGHIPEAVDMAFMSAREIVRDGETLLVSRCGYTGEDGFEISLPAAMAEAFAETLLAHEEVEPAGLGARDSLRLEAGLCLYGEDIDETTSPVEAGLRWSIGKRRREEGGFPGAERIMREIAEGPSRRLVGIKPEGRAPARHGTAIRSADGEEIGVVTSGGFGPTVEGPVTMGYVAAGHEAPGTALGLVVRGKTLEAHVVKLPFVPHRYAK
ncbi:glycine cleavage system aminomethyltransferase GcvT [Kaustia mangrovi]|uniref:aminomethyltransferase n=1 Tax=Kaustia mangrovi TaxID=2593653 RepID=A0A7S8C2F7_9HYPH|nr:glycine cleavage system aminomethyltransferase GcvT [Kaustia mangrovi]QPC42122.1 glycine cleavage system aminomethyltransferase GcvT [Kaustia mangrovi]